MDSNDVIEKMITTAKDFCRQCCAYFPNCIYPACERVEFDGNHVVYRLDPYGVNNHESIQ